MGRKGKYDTHIKPNFMKIRRWREEGYTEAQIQDLLNVSHQTWHKYKNEIPEFNELCAVTKEHLICELEQSLYQRAKGIEYEETKTFQTGDRLRVERTKKFIAPDTTALIFALKNLDSKKWRDRQDINHEGSLQMQFIDDLGVDEDES